MIKKRDKATRPGSKDKDKAAPKSFAERRRQRRVERNQPLEVRMTMRFRFGDEPDDTVTMMDDRAVPMVDNVFKNRDRIVRGFVTLLMKAGLAQPKVARELFPVMKLLRRKTPS
ncbi:MAG TPA: hypothetical protein VLI06_19690 [Solimonas sp.]|nr:hypothetical protein [Solimonas sp.]